MEQTNISDKEWLDLAFKYFIQHAQQRVQHFNYFILFSSLLTTASVTTMQPNFQKYYLGILFGVIQIIVSYFFIKLDNRNRFLIKQSEKVIKYYEKAKKNNNPSLFLTEERETNHLKTKNNFFLTRHFSHKDTYRAIYVTFACIGVISLIINLYHLPALSTISKVSICK